MTRQTFDDAVAKFTPPGAAALAELKQTFEPTLADLRDLKHYYSKRKGPWLSRVGRIQGRQQGALSRGVYHSDVAKGLEELCGGRALHGGLFVSTENQINGAIGNIERLSLEDVPKRHVWLYWDNEPTNIRANMGAIEEGITKLEDLVKDGGKLQRMIEEKSAQPASTPIAPPPLHEAADIKVEQDFSV